jgi:hypothetical protein
MNHRSVTRSVSTVLVAAALVVADGTASADWRGSPSPQPRPDEQTVVVPSNRPEPVWTAPLAAGVIYSVEASGTFSVWPDQREGVDAYYVHTPRVGPRPQPWNQLQIDDRAMLEIARNHNDPIWFNPGHVYATTIRGQGRPVKLQILDARNGSWQDNHGSLVVTIAPRGGYVPAPAPPPPPPPPPAQGGFRPGFPGGRFVVDEIVSVPANAPNPAFSTAPLAPGAVYELEVTGAFSYARGPFEGADAFYAFYAHGRHRRAELNPQLLVDNRPLADLARTQGELAPFNPAHVYVVTLRGTGRPLQLQTQDARNGSWRDNSGGLQVHIRRR